MSSHDKHPVFKYYGSPKISLKKTKLAYLASVIGEGERAGAREVIKGVGGGIGESGNCCRSSVKAINIASVS